MAPLPLALLLAACAPKTASVSPDVLPKLPSPRADVYAHHASRPSDPLVAQALGDVAWDESLAGAAAGVALAMASGEEIDARLIRWKAVLAGYPYPVVAQATARVPHGGVPADLVVSARRLAETYDVGVVRARSHAGDAWVLLAGERRADLPRIPREADVGDTLAAAGVTWVGTDPYGSVRPATGALVLDTAGEWLVRAQVDGQTVATLPLYVAVDTPEHPPIAAPALPSDPEQAAAALFALVQDWYDLDAPLRDPMLDAAARARLRQLLEGTAPPDATAQLRAAGFAGVPAAAAECEAATVADCLDALWWTPELRGPLSGAFESYGVAASRTPGGVLVVLAAAG